MCNEKDFRGRRFVRSCCCRHWRAELISIIELAQEVPEAWMEEIDVNGKTIRIDATIYVPEVETLPVLKVTMIEANDDAVQAYDQCSNWTDRTLFNRKTRTGLLSADYHMGEYTMRKITFCSVF